MSNGLISQDKFLGNYRSKFPEYDAVDDSILLDAIFQKHPQYKDQVELAEPEPEFDPHGEGYDYKTAEAYGIEPSDEGYSVGLFDRDPESGRVLRGVNHPDFPSTIQAENDSGRVVYRGDDGNVYSHPKDSIEVSADSIFSGELASPDSSAEKLRKSNLAGPDTSKKDLHSTDYNIPQINDKVWNSIFKQRFGKDIPDSLPEEAIVFAVEEILQNKSGHSPAGIQNWTAYNNGAWAKYKDWTNEQYISVMGADPKHLELIDQLAGPDSSTLKAVFAAESGFDSAALKENYLPSASVEKKEEPELGIYGLQKVEGSDAREYTLTAAPEKGFWSGVSERVGDIFKYKDLSIAYKGDADPAQVAGRAQAELSQTQLLKDRAKNIGIYHHPNSPEYDQEVREQVAWNVMSEPLLFSGPQKTALGKGFQKGGQKEYLRRQMNPRAAYKKELKRLGVDVTDDDFTALAWSNSLSGMAWGIATGNEPDLTFYEPGDAEQMAAGIVGLLMPLDVFSFGVGGKVAQYGFKSIKGTQMLGKTLNATSGSLARKRLIKLGVDEAVAIRAVERATYKTANAMASFGGALGTYEGIGSPLRQFKEKGFIDPWTTSQDILAHTALGVVTGFLGEAGLAASKYVKPMATGKGVKLTQEGAKFVGEVTGFGGFSPLIVEGRKPTFNDFQEAATFLVGMKLAAPMQRAYGMGAHAFVNNKIADRLRLEWAKNGGDFSKAQETVHKELRTAYEIAMEDGIAWEQGAPRGAWSGGKGSVYGEKKYLSIDENGIAIIHDQFGNRIPFRPALTQKELVLTGEVKRPQLNEEGKPVVGEDGKPKFRTIQSDLYEGETESRLSGYNKEGDKVELVVYADKDGAVADIEVSGKAGVRFVDREAVADANFNIKTDKNNIIDVVSEGFKSQYGGEGEGGFVTTAVGRGQVPEKTGQRIVEGEVSEVIGEGKEQQVVREKITAEEAATKQLELPPHLRGDALKSLPDKVLDVLLEAGDLSPREKQVMRVEQERRRVAGLVAPDVSDLVAQRSGLQVEQNKLFEELGALREGSPEYDVKERQIVEIGDRMRELDSQIGEKTMDITVGRAEKRKAVEDMVAKLIERGEAETRDAALEIIREKGLEPLEKEIRKGLGLKPQLKLPGETEVVVEGKGEVAVGPEGEAGVMRVEGGVMKTPVGKPEVREPEAPPERPVEEAPPGKAVFRDKTFTLESTPAQINNAWNETQAEAYEIREKNTPRLEELQKELDGVKGRKKEAVAERKRIREEMEVLEGEYESIFADAEWQMERAQKELRDIIEEDVRKRGVREEDIDDVVINVMQDALERPGIEWSSKKPLKELIDIEVEDFAIGLEPGKVAPAKEAKLIDDMIAEYESQGGVPTKEALDYAIKTNEYYSSLGENFVRGKRKGLSKDAILARFEELNPEAISSDQTFVEVKKQVAEGDIIRSGEGGGRPYVVINVKKYKDGDVRIEAASVDAKKKKDGTYRDGDIVGLGPMVIEKGKMTDTFGKSYYITKKGKSYVEPVKEVDTVYESIPLNNAAGSKIEVIERGDSEYAGIREVDVKKGYDTISNFNWIEALRKNIPTQGSDKNKQIQREIDRGNEVVIFRHGKRASYVLARKVPIAEKGDVIHFGEGSSSIGSATVTGKRKIDGHLFYKTSGLKKPNGKPLGKGDQKHFSDDRGNDLIRRDHLDYIEGRGKPEVKPPEAPPKPPAKVPDKVPIKKEPWQMTAEEYKTWEKSVPPHKSDFMPAPESPTREALYGREAAVGHALQKGLPVPKEILKEFPIFEGWWRIGIHKAPLKEVGKLTEKTADWQDYKSKNGKRTIARIVEVGESPLGGIYVRKNPDGTYRVARFVQKDTGPVLYSMGDQSYNSFGSALSAAKAEVGRGKPPAEALYAGASEKVKEDFRRQAENVAKMDMPQVMDGGKIYRFTGESTRPDGKETGKWEMFVASMKDSPTQGWQPVKNFTIRRKLDTLLKEKDVAEAPAKEVILETFFEASGVGAYTYRKLADGTWERVGTKAIKEHPGWAHDFTPVTSKSLIKKLEAYVEKLPSRYLKPRKYQLESQRGEAPPPKSLPESMSGVAKLKADRNAEAARGDKADVSKIRALNAQISEANKEVGKAKVGRPRDGDQITLRPTKKVAKGKQAPIKKPIDDPDMRFKLEMQNVFEGIHDQVLEMVTKANTYNSNNFTYTDMPWDAINVPLHSRITKKLVEDKGVAYQPGYEGEKMKKAIHTLEIEYPEVNGTYSVELPSSVQIMNGKIVSDWFKKFSKQAVARSFKRPGKPRLTGGGGRRTAEHEARFTAPTRQAISKIDQKQLNKALTGYKKRLKRLQAYKSPTEEVQASVGQLKEAIKIADDMLKTYNEADRLSGDIVGMDFIPGVSAVFNAMRRWKRSKLPLTDRKKLDSLVERSNKLYGQWNRGGKVDAEMEGRLEQLGREISKLEEQVANQAPSEQEMVKIAKDMEWPNRVRDLRRTHKKQRDLAKQLKKAGVEVPDENYRDIKLEVTKNRTDSQKDFTQEEILHYEEILDRMSRADGYLDVLPEMLMEEIKPETKVDKAKRASMRTFGPAMPHISRIRVMGTSGRELYQKSTNFLIRQQQITGDGEATLVRIKKLIGRRNMNKFVAAIDPYLAEGMEFRGKEKFLNSPKTKEALQLWKDYTDRLHAMRMEYDTYVTMDVNGKSEKVPASETYIENWIRYQLKPEVYKDLAGHGKIFEREIGRLIKSGKAQNRAEAEQIIGEWQRRSTFHNSPVRYGSADRPRIELLSPELYETDFTKLAPGISQRYATFLAGSEVFGQDMAIRDRLVTRIGQEVGYDSYLEAGELMREIVEGSQKKAPWGTMGVTRGVGTLHLTSPRTFYNNIMYSHNTDVPTFGFRAVTKGWMDYLRHPYISVMEARKAGQLGVGIREIESITWEKGLKGWLGWFPGGIVPSEIMNRARSVASAGHAAEIYLRYLAKDMSPEVQRSIPRRKLNRARNFFKEFGGFTEKEIDRMAKRGSLTEKEMAQVKSFAPSLTQGSTHPYFMPEMMSGKFAPLGSLHKMAYRATGAVYKSVVRPALKADFGPMMKWAATGAVGGELSYFINYALFGWEHPQGGDIDDFIEYLHGPDANKDKYKALMMRMGRNIIRAQSFGIMSDWMTGYGFAPIILDAYKNVHNDMYNLATGKKTPKDVISDLGEAQVAVYRDWVRVQEARFQPRSDEFRNHNNVRKYVKNFKKDLGKPQAQMERPSLSQNSPAARHLRDAWWYADADEYKRIMFSARDDYANKKEASLHTLKPDLPPKRLKSHALKAGEKWVEGQIRNMHPLSGIPGKVTVEWEGGKYRLKSTAGKSPEAIIFWENLKDHEKRNVFNSVKAYHDIVKELKIGRFIK